MKQVQQAAAKVRVLVPVTAGSQKIAKQVTASPVKAITFEGCFCWAHN